MQDLHLHLAPCLGHPALHKSLISSYEYAQHQPSRIAPRTQAPERFLPLEQKTNRDAVRTRESQGMYAHSNPQPVDQPHLPPALTDLWRASGL
ncbi:hypothetical protein G6F59_018460 [Rhizopus arrhizus]|nr:hypothetical protein G6F59_018460 [Rhizopus arrhizus]